jgi:hypothetical protein
MKKNVIKLIWFFEILLIGISYNTCKKLTDPISENKFQIYVDSLHVPDSVSFSDTVVCKFWAFIGYDLCYRFSHFETNQEIQPINFKLWGYHTGDNMCLQALSKLSGKEYKFVAVRKGLIRINVLQPDNSVLKDSVFVK